MENEINTMPRIGDQAPSFKARTTQGEITFPDEFEGKWVVLFSHPADFTPVCTSELMTFGKMAEEFAALNCQLIGLSIDGLYSHIAWLHTIEEKIEYRGMKNIKICFPLVEDISMNIAKAYGMLQPEESKTQAVRAVFFIDPTNTIRAIIYYPMALGRNFAEIKRVLIGLQTIDKFGVALPADWQPGDEVIVSGLKPCETKKEHLREKHPDVTCYDWFFCTKPLPKEKIEKAIEK